MKIVMRDNQTLYVSTEIANTIIKNLNDAKQDVNFIGFESNKAVKLLINMRNVVFIRKRNLIEKIYSKLFSKNITNL